MNNNRFSISKIIGASAIGTLIEWYDFYIFGMLSTTIALQFFPKENPTAALLSTLAIFAAGFIVRPFGALVFGRLGDLIGRKHTFLLTLVLMGFSTFLIGFVPGYKTIGIVAPILVLILRLIQGLALGGEYGGAATYVAEHAPQNKRGLYTSWIQTTATLGLFLALAIIIFVKQNLSDEAFNSEWGGWRYPFWISILLVLISIYIRLKMKESPLFAKLKEEGKTSTSPLAESFTHKANFKMVLLALFGAVMGQGVIWYTGQFYTQNFLETKCFIEFEQSRTIMLWAILLATPFFIFWGWLSDKVGRKWIMLSSMLLGIITYRPIFQVFLDDTSNWEKTEAVVINNSTSNSPSPTKEFITFETPEKNQFTKVINYSLDGKEKSASVIINKKLNTALYLKFIFLVFVLIFYVTMVYGPIAAFLVEIFPTKIRYTSMSLPYHIGNGVFGGLTPYVALMLTTIYTEDKLVGLYYPISISVICFLIGTIYLHNKIDKNIMD